MEQFIANGLCRGSNYALTALGFGLIYTTSGVFHIAHGFVYTLAAYALFGFAYLMEMPLWLAVPSALLTAASTGMAVEVVVHRPLYVKQASAAVHMISSLGVYIIGVNAVAMFFGTDTKMLRRDAVDVFHFGNVVLTRIQIAQLVTALFVFSAFWLFLKWSSVGRTCRAVADDPVLASVMGVHVERARLLAFALGSVLAAIGAVLIAVDVGADPYGGMPVVLASVVACVVGGLRRLLAPALGGLFLGLTQSLVVWKASAHWESAVTFGILIVFLLFRPQGILGTSERVEETP